MRIFSKLLEIFGHKNSICWDRQKSLNNNIALKVEALLAENEKSNFTKIYLSSSNSDIEDVINCNSYQRNIVDLFIRKKMKLFNHKGIEINISNHDWKIFLDIVYENSKDQNEYVHFILFMIYYLFTYCERKIIIIEDFIWALNIISYLDSLKDIKLMQEQIKTCLNFGQVIEFEGCISQKYDKIEKRRKK